MKRTKMLKSLAVIPAIAMPMASMLVGMTSCGKKDYTELVSEMKDFCVTKFLELCKSVHRNAFNEGEAYAYVKKEMQGLGYVEPSGYDNWSQLNAVRYVGEGERAALIKAGEPDGGNYGNIWYDIEPTEGYEDVPKIIVHTHIDSQMYFGDTETEAQWHAKWGKEGIPVNYDRDNDIITTDKETKISLGADGGVGIATLLTLAKFQKRFNHGAIRLLFAVGESEPLAPVYEGTTEKYPEYSAGFDLLYWDQIFDKETPSTWPTGEDTASFQPQGTRPFGDNCEYRYLISAAAVNKNIIFQSTAGVHDCQVSTSTPIDLNKVLANTTQGNNNLFGNQIDWQEKAPKEISEWQHTDKKRLVSISVSGLQGGTTSNYIDNGQGNALKMLAYVMFSGDTDIQIVNTTTYPDSGYSICTEASALFSSFYSADTWQIKIDSLLPTFQALFPNEDWRNVKITVEEKPSYATVKYGLSKKASRDLIRMIANDLHFGPYNWFESGDVKTSQNVGPCNISITNTSTEEPKASIKLHVVERSSDHQQLDIFKHLTHKIFDDGLVYFFNCGLKETEPTKTQSEVPTIKSGWQDDNISHVHDPAWEAPDPTKGEVNNMVRAFDQAFNNFKINHKIGNEHAWLEVASASAVYKKLGKECNLVLIGPQIDKNHSTEEVLYSDSITTLLETIVYVLDNARGLLPPIE